LSAVTFAKLEARHQHGNRAHAFSMASLKRRAFKGFVNLLTILPEP
jgi:hypothetical protein